MPERAHVTSVEAIGAFRSDLVLYISKVRPALEEISAEVMAVRVWLEQDRRTYWENQLKRRRRAWNEAQAALFSARMSNLREESAAEVQAVHRCKRACEDAESKLLAVKRWNRNFEGSVQPLVKQMEKLQTLISSDLPKAIAYLSELIRTLDAYAGITAPSSLEAAPTAGPMTGTSTADSAKITPVSKEPR